MKDSTMVVLGVLLIAVIGLGVLFFVVRKTPTPSPAPSPPSPAPPSPPSPPTPTPSDDEMLDCLTFGELIDQYKMSYSQAQSVQTVLGADRLKGGGKISKQKVLDYLQKHNIKPSKNLNQWQWVCCPQNDPLAKIALFIARGTADPSTLCGTTNSFY